MASEQGWDHLLGPEPRILDAAKKLWTNPTPIQTKAIPIALQGKDILAKARTGSGKTAAYIIPILIGILHSPLPWTYNALILVPTRELCEQVKQQIDEIAQYTNITTTHLGDDLFTSTIRAKLAANPPCILVGTPARVSALITPSEKSFLDSVKFLVVDEADQQLGLDHGPDIESIISKLPQTHQSFLMSATLGEEVEKLQSVVLNSPLRIECDESSDKPLLSHYYLKVPEDNRYEVLYTLIQCGRIGKRLLLFVNSSSRGYKLRLFLERFGIRSSILNSMLPAGSRIHILQEFNKGNIDVIVAIDETDEAVSTEFSASRGVDFKKIQTVVNFDLPSSFEQYVHRVGRTARGEHKGAALTFVSPGQSIDEISAKLSEAEGVSLSLFEFDTAEAEIFRYRVSSVLETITKKQIKESRKLDIKREIMNSEALKAHFDENPADLQMMKHDAQLLPKKIDRSLRVLPDYLGKQVKRLQHPLTQKARQAKMDSAKTKRQLANLESLDEAIKKKRKLRKH